MAKPALGRGLGALLGSASMASTPASQPARSTPVSTPAAFPAQMEAQDRVQRVPANRVRPSPWQPRKDFTQESLQELADSIREQGILQPLVVRLVGDAFELIAGERRWRAAQLAGLKEVPVLVREANDATALELALIENLQREDLNPLEQALGYQKLQETFHLRQEDIAQRVGKSRAAIANSLRLLHLPSDVQALVRAGQLSAGHAKAVLSLPNPQWQSELAHRVVKQDLNVRQAEEAASKHSPPQSSQQGGAAVLASSSAPHDVHVAALEDKLRERLATKVRLRYAKGKGSVEIKFFTDDDLERVLGILGVAAE